jgi:hypothetical protein
MTAAYADLGLTGRLPVAERHAEQMCTLPLWPGMSDEQADRVVAAVRDFTSRPGWAHPQPAGRLERPVEASAASTRS